MTASRSTKNVRQIDAELAEIAKFPGRTARVRNGAWEMRSCGPFQAVAASTSSAAARSRARGGNNRYRERGFTAQPYSYKQRVEDLTDRLAKIESKLAGLMF